MRIIWIGDQRSAQIKYWQKVDEAQQNKEDREADDVPAYEFEYILDNNADSSWFSSIASKKALNLVDTDTVIIVSSGLNDCINSSLWDSFSIKNLAAEYVKTLKELAARDTNCRVYFCTVTPVNASIPKSEASNGLLDKKIINEKILIFNNHIKVNSSGTYSCIDCQYYVDETSFATRDGLLYTSETCLHIFNYILNNIKTTTVNFPARLADKNPLVFDKEEINETDKFYTLISYDGLNEYVVEGNINQPFEGSALPNCTAYAWGRFYEITGERPNLLNGSAERWFGYDEAKNGEYVISTNGVVTENDFKKMAEHGEAKDGYKRGTEPKEGAVICWEGKNGESGHVAIVEKVTTNSDGTTSIITSESGWQNNPYWWTTERDNSNGNWGANKNTYIFQGFIYCPAVTPTATAINVKKDDVITKAKGLNQSEMEINAKYIWKYLGSLPEDQRWTLQAVAGILGNMQMESSINPGRQEDYGTGFGLVQWTPANETLIPWCKENGLDYKDIDAQLQRLLYEKDTKIEYYKKHYKYTFDEFTKSTDSAYELACAFAFDYERSAVTLWGFHRGIKGDVEIKHTKYHVTPPHNRPYCKKSNYDSKCETNCKAYKWCYLQKFGKARTEQQMEKNKQDLRDARGGAAEKWFKFLLPYAPGSYFEEKFIVENLKIDRCSTTSIAASFITSNAKSGTAKLFDPNSDSKKPKDSKKLSVATEEGENVAINSFNFSGLTPNTTYKLVIEIESNLKSEKLTNTLEFTTAQSYPKALDKVNLYLSSADKLKVYWSKLSDSDWGYWKSKGCGYTLNFFKNGKQIIADIKTSETSHEFKLSDIPDKIKLDDTIQIGVRPWVKDDLGNFIYANNSPTVSNVVKFLKQPIKIYLNL